METRLWCGIVWTLIVWILIISGTDAFHMAKRRKCQYPCQCPVRELKCSTGVSIMKDGCDCCYMCARQHGDICNVKDRCDSKVDLYCDLTARPQGRGTGICRAQASKPCVVNGKSYRDGEKFKPECSRQCTCQNGNYGCVDLCPEEFRTPSLSHCSRPRLMAVAGQCCKQWTCDVMQRPDSQAGKSPRHALMDGRPSEYRYRSALTDTEPPHRYKPPQLECVVNSTQWTRCSVTCDMGISTRHYTDKKCKRTEETKLCYLRPCGTIIPSKNSKKCTPTARTRRKRHLHYQDCVSVRQYRFKYCTDCKTNRCCYPRRTKTRLFEFECGDGGRQLFSFMWIKSCRCDRVCYQKDYDDNIRKG